MQIADRYTIHRLIILFLVLGGFGLLSLSVLKQRQKALQIMTAEMSLEWIEEGALEYEADFDVVPRSLDTIAAHSWRGVASEDPWGNPYRYELIEGTEKVSARIASNGPDGQLGTDDDIERVLEFISEPRTSEDVAVEPEGESEPASQPSQPVGGLQNDNQ